MLIESVSIYLEISLRSRVKLVQRTKTARPVSWSASPQLHSPTGLSSSEIQWCPLAGMCSWTCSSPIFWLPKFPHTQNVITTKLLILRVFVFFSNKIAVWRNFFFHSVSQCFHVEMYSKILFLGTTKEALPEKKIQNPTNTIANKKIKHSSYKKHLPLDSLYRRCISYTTSTTTHDQ